jgi:hypothetical protein
MEVSRPRPCFALAADVYVGSTVTMRHQADPVLHIALLYWEINELLLN